MIHMPFTYFAAFPMPHIKMTLCHICIEIDNSVRKGKPETGFYSIGMVNTFCIK